MSSFLFGLHPGANFARQFLRKARLNKGLHQRGSVIIVLKAHGALRTLGYTVPCCLEYFQRVRSNKNRDVPVADVHAGPSGPRVRELGGDGGHRAPGQVSLVPARSRPGLSRGGAEPTRIGDESESAGRLPRGEL